MAKKFKRTRLWVDPPVQARMLLRLGTNLFLYALVVGHIGFFFQLLAVVGQPSFNKGIVNFYIEYLLAQTPLIWGFVLVLPLMLFEMLKFSHRIAGPLFRCRRLMREMAEGKAIGEFIPRKGDLLTEFFQAFNVLIDAWNRRLAAGGTECPEAASTPAAGPPEAAPPAPPSPRAEAQFQVQPVEIVEAN
jgi:hypothetical protein